MNILSDSGRETNKYTLKYIQNEMLQVLLFICLFHKQFFLQMPCKVYRAYTKA